MKMNPEVKTKWVAKLTSGELEQGTDYLAKDGKYCCLGVLCEIARDEGVIETVEIKPISPVRQVDRYNPNVTYYDGERAELPKSVATWAGLQYETSKGVDPMTDPFVPDLDTTLAAINDSGYDFDHIARVIDEYF